jgi:hypothetical protein
MDKDDAFWFGIGVLGILVSALVIFGPDRIVGWVLR